MRFRQWENYLEKQLEFIEYEKRKDKEDISVGERAFTKALIKLAEKGEDYKELGRKYAKKYNDRIGNKYFMKFHDGRI